MRRDGFWIANWEKLAAFAFGVVFIATMLAIAHLVPNPTPTQWFMFRVVLALAAGGIAAVIPGLIAVNASKYVRAGGAIAVFLLVYWFNPPRPVVGEMPRTSITQTTSGQNSPAVVSKGDVTITNQNNDQKEKKKK
ncbi:MAG: hypothetical protein WBS19_15980 [Candidatus Korobacteraceae bacterium]